MKKLLALFLVLAVALTACAPVSPDEEEDLPDNGELTVFGAAQAILEACGLAEEELEHTEQTLGKEGLSAYLENFYGLEPDSWEECVICRAGGSQALEIAVIHFTTNAAARAALEGLGAYLTAREGDFTGYAPEQAALVAASRAVRLGRFAALLICDDPQGAQEAFENYLGGSASASGPMSGQEPSQTGQELHEPDTQDPKADPNAPQTDPDPVGPDPNQGPVTYPGRVPYTQPGKDDMTLYDTAPILAAWASGDSEGLSEKDRDILAQAARVLADTMEEGMTDAEKERALYRWIVSRVTYDHDHYNLLTGASPDSYSPYNPLLQGKGVCLGFASTFQLLMDMAGVECITVVGAAFSSREDHAWNMVRLDGIWYCVDATWDTGNSERRWQYFNVSSDYMARTDHQWDYNAVPETGQKTGGGEGREAAGDDDRPAPLLYSSHNSTYVPTSPVPSQGRLKAAIGYFMNGSNL